MPSLFLSHSSADKTFVEKLAKDLEGVGVNVWFRFLYKGIIINHNKNRASLH